MSKIKYVGIIVGSGVERSRSAESFITRFLSQSDVIMTARPPAWLLKFAEEFEATIVDADSIASVVELCNYFLLIDKDIVALRDTVGDKLLQEITRTKKSTIAMWG